MRRSMRLLGLFLSLFAACMIIEAQGRGRRARSVYGLSEDFDPDEFEGLGEVGAGDLEDDDHDGGDDSHYYDGVKEDDEDAEDSLSDDDDEDDIVEREIESNGGWGDDSNDEFFEDDPEVDDDVDDEFAGDDEFDSPKIPRKKERKSRRQRNQQSKESKTAKGSKRRTMSQKTKEKSSGSGDNDASTKKSKSSKWGMPEMFGLACVLFYGIVYFAGSSMNERKASKWIEAFYPVVSSQFYMVGETVMDTSGKLNTRSLRSLLTKESQSNYRLYASGRENADGLIANLELDARQDFFGLVWGLFTSSNDMLSIDIPMDSTRMHPFIMAVLPAVEATSIVGSEYCSDIKQLAREVKAAQQYLPTHLVLYSDCNFNEILALLPKSKLSKNSSASGMTISDFLSSPFFHSLHVTDQNARALPQVALNNVVALKNIRFKFKLPRDSNKMSELLPLLEFALGHYIDRVATFSLSPKAKSKAKGIRDKLISARTLKQGAEEREDRLAKRKEEKEKARKEKLDRMNPKEREKFMEKEAARLRKKRMKKAGGKIRVAM